MEETKAEAQHTAAEFRAEEKKEEHLIRVISYQERIHELEQDLEHKKIAIQNRNTKIAELEAQVEKTKSSLEQAIESANRQEQWEVCSVLKDIYKDCFEGDNL